MSEAVGRICDGGGPRLLPPPLVLFCCAAGLCRKTPRAEAKPVKLFSPLLGNVYPGKRVEEEEEEEWAASVVSCARPARALPSFASLDGLEATAPEESRGWCTPPPASAVAIRGMTPENGGEEKEAVKLSSIVLFFRTSSSIPSASSSPNNSDFPPPKKEAAMKEASVSPPPSPGSNHTTLPDFFSLFSFRPVLPPLFSRQLFRFCGAGVVSSSFSIGSGVKERTDRAAGEVVAVVVRGGTPLPSSSSSLKEAVEKTPVRNDESGSMRMAETALVLPSSYLPFRLPTAAFPSCGENGPLLSPTRPEAVGCS